MSAPEAKSVAMDYAAQFDVDNYIVSVDPEGVLGWVSQYIEKKRRPWTPVIEVLTEQISNEYLNYLRSFDISYIFAGAASSRPRLRRHSSERT